MKILRSYKLFSFGNRRHIILAAWFAVVAACGFTLKNIAAFEDFLSGFVGVQHMVIPCVLSCIALNGTMLANSANAGFGYKFFRSLPNAEKHFRRAVLGGNIISLLGTAFIAVVGSFYLESTLMLMFSVVLSVVFLSIMNFVQYIENYVVKLVLLMMTIGFAGGIVGFFGEREFTVPNAVVLYTLVICAAVYAVSLVYVLTNSKKFTGKEQKK